MTSQPSGPASSAPTWSRGRPWKRSASLRPTDLFGADARASAASIDRLVSLDESTDHPLISVQALTQSL